MKHLVILSGAGVSAESGISTFRDSDGLWEQYDVMQVASIQGWQQDPELMLRFYNERRRQLKEVLPNSAHNTLAEMQNDYTISIITQNVDNLHERAGSNKVLHLHGILTQARSSLDSKLIYEIGYNDILWGQNCIKGSQIRPNIVWFGEDVPAIEEAINIVQSADIFTVIGSSLNVYPAAGLVKYIAPNVPMFVIDPKEVSIHKPINCTFIKEQAAIGVAMLRDLLLTL